MNEENLDLVIDELAIDENFEKSGIEMATCELMEKLYDPQKTTLINQLFLS